MTRSRTWKRTILALLCCGACLLPGTAFAQTRSPEQFNGSDKTGTNGQIGNSNCAPPVVTTADGTPVTPLNWSCDSSGYWPSRSPYTQAPVQVTHPGPMDPSDPNNPCIVQGHNYDWRNNPPGTYLPPGCVRPSNGGIRTITPPAPPRGRYQPMTPRFQSPAPPVEAGLDGDYPGKFLGRDDYPGAHLGPNGEPLQNGSAEPGYPAYRRPQMPQGHMPLEIFIPRIPPMPAGQIAPGR